MDTLNQENAVLSQNQPTPSEQPKQSNFLTILLSVLLFLSVSIAGFFAYQTQKLVNELTVLKTQSTAITTPISEIDPAANWKTYSDEKGHFLFKYPNNWSSYLPKVEGGAFNLYIAPVKTIEELTKLYNSGGGFGGGKFMTMTVTKVLEIPVYKSDEFQNVAKSTIKIDGQDMPKYTTDVIQDMQGFNKGDKIETIVVKTEEDYLVISLLDYQYKNIFDQILSTFKFEDTDLTANWKTYEMNRIDFKYPQNYFVEPQSSEANVTIFNKNTGSGRYYISISEIDGSLQQLVQTGVINKDQLTDIKISFAEKGFYTVKELSGTALPVGVSETIYLIDQVNSYIEIRFWNNTGTLNSEYELFKKNVELILSSLSFKG